MPARVREIISSEMWIQLNTFYLMVNSAASSGKGLESPHNFYNEVKLASHLFTGVTDATMTHGEAWHFARLGRKLERADKTSRILDVKYFILLRSVSEVGTLYDDVQWVAVLRSASAFEMYRKRHGRMSPMAIVEFLLLDGEFPRAVRFCLNSARDSLHAISGAPAGTQRKQADKLLAHICVELAHANVNEIISGGLHEYLDRLQTNVNRVSTGIYERFFAARVPESAQGAKGQAAVKLPMAIHVALYHKTHYTYDRPVAHAPHTVRLRPAPHCRTPILSYSQRIKPKKTFPQLAAGPVQQLPGPAGFSGKDRGVLIEVDLVAEMAVYNPFDFFLEPTARKMSIPIRSGI